ncbi:MAG: pimeloyl-ACP methyl ester esterase BioH, partial [Formivibrio sp.]|nr:pimeloyl-ACP methyl ester esterase BioH [Formivibrio sp.]
YCVHLVDLPGHGKSGMAEPYTLDELVRQVDVAFPYPVQVIGWSLGGAVATQWALNQPDKVRSLTLVASTPCFAQRDNWTTAMSADTLTQFFGQLQTDWRGTLKRFIGLQAMGDAAARAVARELTHDLFSHGDPPLAALEHGLEILRDTDLRGEVGKLACPVLLQYGDKDMLTPLGAAQWLAQSVPQSLLVVHAGAAHAPFLSHADDFVAEQRRFLDGI